MLNPHPIPPRGSSPDQAKWQDRVVKVLWIFLAFLLSLTFLVLYGKTRGLFDRVSQDTGTLWPDNRP